MLEIVTDSHLDHGLNEAHVEWLKGRFEEKNAFFIATVEIPEHLPALECGLYGPIMGDADVAEDIVRYTVRGNRKCATREVPLSKRPTRHVTVIAGPHNGKACVLFTAYGGPSAPREPGDLTLKSYEEVLEARAFWAVHALATEVK